MARIVKLRFPNKKKWTPDEIKKRGMSMLQFMEHRWNFKFKDWNIDKEEILLPFK